MCPVQTDDKAPQRVVAAHIVRQLAPNTSVNDRDNETGFANSPNKKTTSVLTQTPKSAIMLHGQSKSKAVGVSPF